MGILSDILGSILPFSKGGTIIKTPKGPVLVIAHTRGLPNKKVQAIIKANKKKK